MDEINTEIAELRGEKDVVNEKMPGVDIYVALVEELRGYANEISAAVPALAECQARRKRDASLARVPAWVMLLGGAVAGAIAGSAIGFLVGKQ